MCFYPIGEFLRTFIYLHQCLLCCVFLVLLNVETFVDEIDCWASHTLGQELDKLASKSSLAVAQRSLWVLCG